MVFTTYAHYKPDGSMFYIGKGSVRRAYSSSGRNIIWKRIVEKHGGFKVEILSRWETEQDAFAHEIFLINSVKKKGVQLANIAAGGLGATGCRHSEEHKAKMSDVMKTKNPMHNIDIKRKHQVAVKAAMNRTEVKKRQSMARLGKKFSDSHIESLRNCHPTRPCVINGIEYKSLMDASRMLNIRHGTLHRWLDKPCIKHIGKYAHITECRWL